MAIVRRFTEPLQVVDTEEMVGRITAVADARKVSKAQVVREMCADGIEEQERRAGLRDTPEAVAHTG